MPSAAVGVKRMPLQVRAAPSASCYVRYANLQKPRRGRTAQVVLHVLHTRFGDLTL